MNMDTDRDTVEFWSSLFQSFADSEPKDGLYPVVRSPIMTMSTLMTIDEPAEPWKVLEYGGQEVRPMAIDVPAEPWKVLEYGEHEARPMAIDVPAEPWKVLEYGGNESRTENAPAEVGYQNLIEDQEKYTQKAIEKGKEKEEAAKEESKSLGKRPRGNEARVINEKRRRRDINSKIETLKELTHCDGKNSWRNMYGPMMPMGMVTDIPAPWVYPYNYVPPHYMMYYNHFPAPGETSGYANPIVPYPTYQNFQGFNNNNQPPTTKPM
ncbi:unnamed protein product [Arabidopsis arenosa]|uniref:Uncharacterized protein n=3 Tax=Arabidopsis TaxID=3701 RepID=A0A8S1ZR52_ARAAE|nr:unnamed protein product [Arabidopsis arenosa]